MLTDVHPPVTAVRDAVERALMEDFEPLGDLTGALLGVVETYATGAIVSRDEGVLAGRLCAVETFRSVDPDVMVSFDIDDGSDIQPGTRLATVSGSMASILAAERTALNFLGQLSGVATITRRHVRAVHGRCRILDTRKTTPGLRSLQKAAVRAGGGFNHRASLSDGVMLKDNHLGRLGITETVHRAKLRWPGRMVHVECETIDQVDEAVQAGAHRVMLDNMSPELVAACVELVAKRAEVEVTGGVGMHNLSAYADAGPDFISIGALTHSAPVVDLGLDLDPDR